MTAPVPHGYPDWNRVSAQADTQLFNIDNNVINALTAHNIGFVGNNPAIGVRFRADTNSFRMEFNFYEDAAFTTFMDDWFADIRAGQTFNRGVPTLGPYLQILVDPSAAASQYDLRLWTLQAPMAGIQNEPNESIILASTALAVAAGATTTLDGLHVYPGAAVWNVMSEATSWSAILQSISFGGAIRRMDRVVGVANESFNRNTYLPATSIQVALTNNDAVARNFWTYITARPMHPGA